MVRYGTGAHRAGDHGNLAFELSHSFLRAAFAALLPATVTLPGRRGRGCRSAAAGAATGGYLEVMRKIADAGIGKNVSLKLTQLGLDIDRATCVDNLRRILDEATAALDPSSEAGIYDTVRSLRGRTTILAISHQPGLLSVADRVYRLQRGRVRLLEGDERFAGHDA